MTAPTPITATSDSATDNPVVAYCKKVLAANIPYVFATPRPITTGIAQSYDCSGLAACAWATQGINITPYTVTMYSQVAHRPISQAQPGDLIFYQDNTGYIYHVAINIGNGQLIEAPEPGENVHQRSWSASDPDIMQEVGALPGTTTAKLAANVHSAESIGGDVVGAFTDPVGTVANAVTDGLTGQLSSLLGIITAPFTYAGQILKDVAWLLVPSNRYRMALYILGIICVGSGILMVTIATGS